MTFRFLAGEEIQGLDLAQSQQYLRDFEQAYDLEKPCIEMTRSEIQELDALTDCLGDVRDHIHQLRQTGTAQ